jgi:hypothetical protein
MSRASTIRELNALIGHLIVFEVEVDKPSNSDGFVQTPVLILTEVRESARGFLLLAGWDAKKVTSPDKLLKAFRRYRVDRIRGKIVDMGPINSKFTLPHPNEEGFISL